MYPNLITIPLESPPNGAPSGNAQAHPGGLPALFMAPREGTPSTAAGVRAAQRLDPPVPVLMMVMNDPVGAGLVSSLANPGNHTSGTASLNQDLPPKMLEFVREIF